MASASTPTPSTPAISGALICLECKRPAGSERGWRAYRCDLDDTGRDEVLLYCPSCSEREFGESYQHAGCTI